MVQLDYHKGRCDRGAAFVCARRNLQAFAELVPEYQRPPRDATSSPKVNRRTSVHQTSAKHAQIVPRDGGALTGPEYPDCSWNSLVAKRPTLRRPRTGRPVRVRRAWDRAGRAADQRIGFAHAWSQQAE